MKLFITTMFYIILLCGVCWGGYKLIENTKPSSSKELDRLISAIKELKINQRRISGTNNKSHKETTTEYLIASKMGPSGKYLPLGKTVEKTSIVPEQEEQSIISEKDLDTLLKSVAFAARKEATDEYKNNFSILLTILTIFGIAWPVIIALLQFKFSENELHKIDLAQTEAISALSSANDAQKKANESIEMANKIQKDEEENLKRLNEQTAIIYDRFAQMAYDMGCEAVERLKCYPGDGKSVQWGEEIDYSPADMYFLQSINYHLLEAEIDMRRLHTTAIIRKIDRVTDKRSAVQIDALESCIISAQRIYKTTQNTDIKGILEKLEAKKKSRRGKITVIPLSNEDISDKETSLDKGETMSNQEARK